MSGGRSRTRFSPDRQSSARMLTTMFLLGGCTRRLPPCCSPCSNPGSSWSGIAAAPLAAQYWFSDEIAL